MHVRPAVVKISKHTPGPVEIARFVREMIVKNWDWGFAVWGLEFGGLWFVL